MELNEECEEVMDSMENDELAKERGATVSIDLLSTTL
jgi:hypothetical protein